MHTRPSVRTGGFFCVGKFFGVGKFFYVGKRCILVGKPCFFLPLTGRSLRRRRGMP